MYLPPPTQVGNLADILGQANQIRAQILQNKLSAMKNNMTQQTLPSTIAATNAQNNIATNTAPAKTGALNATYNATEQTAVPQAQANLTQSQIGNKIKAFMANNPQMLAPNTPSAQALAGSLLSKNSAPGAQVNQQGSPITPISVTSPYADYIRQQQNQNSLNNSRANYYRTLTNTMGMRYMPQLNRQQLVSSLQHLGYPAASISNILTHPQDAQNIVQQQTQYTDWVKTANPNSSVPTIQGQSGGGQPQAPISQSVVNGGATGTQAAISNAANIAAKAKQQSSQTDSDILTKTTTTDQRNRLNAAARAVPALQTMRQLLPQASKYAGYLQTGSKLAQQLAQTKDPSFIAYMKYKQAQAAAEADTANAIGIRETDSGFKQFAPLFNIDGWSSSPSTAKPLFDNMMSLVEKESLPNAQNISDQVNYIKSNPLSQSSPSVVHIQAPNGKVYAVPQSDVAQALSAGGKRIG